MFVYITSLQLYTILIILLYQYTLIEESLDHGCVRLIMIFVHIHAFIIYRIKIAQLAIPYGLRFLYTLCMCISEIIPADP